MKKTVWAVILTVFAALTAPAGTVNMDYEAKNYSIAEKDAVDPVLPPLLSAGVLVLPPQATRDNAMASSRTKDTILFFIWVFLALFFACYLCYRRIPSINP